MQIHELKRKTKNKKHVQVGRGGKRGKTAGRGTKGQGARAGRKIRPEIRDRIKRLPKLRGYAFNSIQKKPIALDIAKIEAVFDANSEVSIDSLLKSNLIKKIHGRNPKVKIVGSKKTKDIKKKIIVSGVPVTHQVKELIVKAGGEVK